MQISRPLAAAAARLLLTGCSTLAPIEEPVPVQAPAGTSAADMRTAIRQAASTLRFRFVSETDHAVRLSYPSHPEKREKFHADFEVRYDAEHFEVHYLTSDGLGEQMGCRNAPADRCVHHNVMRWMRNLSYKIDGCLARLQTAREIR